MAADFQDDDRRDRPTIGQPAIDNEALRERSDFSSGKIEFRQGLKKWLRLSTLAFAAATLALLAAGCLLPARPVVLHIAAAMQAATMLWLAGYSVYAISNLHRTNLRAEAVTSLSVVVIAMILGLAVSYHVFGLASPENPREVDFLSSLYFSVVTITTLGYGDMRPLGISRFFAALEALIGYVLLGTFVGLLVSWMTPAPQGDDDC